MCPNGHAALKLVPIVYGLIPRSPETDRKVANLEAFYGGCVVNKYGKYRVVCTVCGCSTFADPYPWYDKTGRVEDTGKALKPPGLSEPLAPGP